MTKYQKEIIEKSEFISNENKIPLFDWIYILPTNKKYDSGYKMMYVVGYEKENDKYYLLSKFSDVIDFERIEASFNWFCSIDIPNYNVIRLFVRHNEKIKVDYLNCSSFTINIITIKRKEKQIMSDLDNEEYEATKSLKEKSADEMFVELGYRKVQETNKFAMYANKLDLEICFYKNSKSIGINTDTGETVFGTTIYGCTDITLQELQAINKKCKELGWLDE